MPMAEVNKKLRLKIGLLSLVHVDYACVINNYTVVYFSEMNIILHTIKWLSHNNHRSCGG